MTIKELYAFAKKNNLENYDIIIENEIGEKPLEKNDMRWYNSEEKTWKFFITSEEYR